MQQYLSQLYQIVGACKLSSYIPKLLFCDLRPFYLTTQAKLFIGLLEFTFYKYKKINKKDEKEQKFA